MERADLVTGAVRWTRQVTPGDVYVSNCRAGNPNCPEMNGPDVDFGSPPMLTRAASGRDLIVIGQKSGVGYALDPDKQGAIVWQYRAGRGGLLGGIEWGSAVDGERAYFAVSDVTTPQPGGLHAVTLTTGNGRNAYSVSFGLIAIMNARAPVVNTSVFAEYMIAGPSNCRTAFRSLVARAMMSPVRVRW